MENLEKKRGCVYFFRHIGLTPIKIGYSENETPLGRFEQFKTYAPYGVELLGFIPTYYAKKLETDLHIKYSAKRLKGEWFEISKEDVENEIEINMDLDLIRKKNEFELSWAKNLFFDSIIPDFKKMSKKEIFITKYKINSNINITKEAESYGVSRMAIYKWIKSIKK